MSTNHPVNLSTIPLKVGLTGGIGSGKTTVARIFEILGVPVYFADAVSKSLYHSDLELAKEIRKQFGDDIYPKGKFDKRRLASVVFGNAEKLEQLNKLVHPPTITHAENWMASQTSPYVIKEAALIFESGSAAGLDLVIGVQAPEPLRILRAMKRDGISREQVMQRMKQQVEEKIKMSLCDYVIINDEQQAVLPQVLSLHEKLMEIVKGER